MKEFLTVMTSEGELFIVKLSEVLTVDSRAEDHVHIILKNQATVNLPHVPGIRAKVIEALGLEAL